MNREDQAAIAAAQDIYKGLPKCHQCAHFKEDKGSVYWHDCAKHNMRIAGNSVACFEYTEKGGEL